MKQPWESDECAAVPVYDTHYPIPAAAALWCGAPLPDGCKPTVEVIGQRDQQKHQVI